MTPSSQSQQSDEEARLRRRVEQMSASLRVATSALADVTRQVEAIERAIAQTGLERRDG